MARQFSTIQQKVRFEASPQEVYDALMDSAKHTEFTGSPARMSAEVGERFEAWDGYIFGRNIELVPGKKIVQEWTTTEWPEGYPPSRLEITLTKRGKGTDLTMVHSRVPREQKESYDGGWYTSYWEPLKAYFANK